jgi:ubiquinol-cytochrome c reductase iron-sulfur subunit
MHTIELKLSEREIRRRKILLAATAGLGGIGTVATLVPFIESMAPSEAAKAAGAPVEADLSRVPEGGMSTVEWRGKPIWIVHRTSAMVSSLQKVENLLVDPLSIESQQPPYTRNPTRSIKPRYFVAIGICTHLGCIPNYRPNPASAGETTELGQNWLGGFYCPCHGSRFDLAGRVFKNVPAPVNLEIPPHRYLSDTRLLIGEDKKRT